MYSHGSSRQNILPTIRKRELSSGKPALDQLLGGGLPAGTSTLLIGPAGVGKPTVATQFAVAAAARQERTALFVFDENIGTFRSRSRKLGMPVDAAMAQGWVSVQQVDPAELSSGEFATTVRRAAEGTDGVGPPAKIIVVDSLNGYLNAIKKRNGRHERTIREFDMDETGIVIGDPLTDFQGVLTGVPTYRGASTHSVGDGSPVSRARESGRPLRQCQFSSIYCGPHAPVGAPRARAGACGGMAGAFLSRAS